MHVNGSNWDGWAGEHVVDYDREEEYLCGVNVAACWMPAPVAGVRALVCGGCRLTDGATAVFAETEAFLRHLGRHVDAGHITGLLGEEVAADSWPETGRARGLREVGGVVMTEEEARAGWTAPLT